MVQNANISNIIQVSVSIQIQIVTYDNDDYFCVFPGA